MQAGTLTAGMPLCHPRVRADREINGRLRSALSCRDKALPLCRHTRVCSHPPVVGRTAEVPSIDTFEHAAYRYGRRAFPVLQHRDGRSYRRKILEALSTKSDAGLSTPRDGSDTPGHRDAQFVPISAADRSHQRAIAKARGRAWAPPIFASAVPGPTPPILRIRTSRPRCLQPASRRSDPPAMARASSIFASGGCADRDVVRGKPGNRDAAGVWTPDQAQTPSRLYQLDRRQASRPPNS